MQIFIDESKKTQCFAIPFIKNNLLNTHLTEFGKYYGLSDNIISQIQEIFTAEPRESYPIVLEDGRKFCLLGVKPPTVASDLIAPFRVFSYQHSRRLHAQLTLDFRFFSVEVSPEMLSAAVNGMLLGAYNLALHKTTPPSRIHPFTHSEAFMNVLSLEKAKNLKKTLDKIRITVETQMSAMNLVNAPANFKTPVHLANWAKKSAEKFDYEATIFDKAGCEKLGLHALLAVGQGSVNDVRFIIMEHKGGDKNMPTVALVGKGITFDSGGISIKPSANMYLMKSDMGGAAAVFGAVELAARLDLKINVIGIVCSAENMPDANAYKPSDVISSYSGKTIEIIDTDAEGRLVLADGLAYAVKNYAPDYLIDLATLTGSAVAALGYQCAALLTPNDDLAKKLIAAGTKSGEKLWQLPMWEGYFEDLKSDVADITNLGNKPVAGAITAAKFLEFFTEKHPRWAHLDIASMAMTANEFGTHRNATAYGVRLLIEFMNDLISEK